MNTSNILNELKLEKKEEAMLKHYSDLVLGANKEFNLISKNTESSILEGHIYDSAQLIDLFPNNTKSFCDVGSGAGFPGLVLKIIDSSLEGYLVEPIKKKADFLKNAAKQIGAEVNVIQEKYQNIKNTHALSSDIITARALMPLSGLLDLFSHNIIKGTIGIFPKGRSWEKEISDAQAHWKIDYNLFTSKTSKDSRIIIVDGLKRYEQ